jgi:hypothetical protein
MLKTFDVPETVPFSKLKAFLADLGFDVSSEHLIGFRAGADGVFAEWYAVNEDGYRYYEPVSGEVATHRIAIRLDTDA